jgi:hypothetical protein
MFGAICERSGVGRVAGVAEAQQRLLGVRRDQRAIRGWLAVIVRVANDRPSWWRVTW